MSYEEMKKKEVIIRNMDGCSHLFLDCRKIISFTSIKTIAVPAYNLKHTKQHACMEPDEEWLPARAQVQDRVDYTFRCDAIWTV